MKTRIFPFHFKVLFRDKSISSIGYALHQMKITQKKELRYREINRLERIKYYKLRGRIDKKIWDRKACIY
ncbi:hypothetical protein D5R40_03565 [Okeania hirsuta]|uniref:Uncharacterized protein n=1 Tax=Okeania hirsuta TaxID=1458930 RepID=A0A3N6R2S8_9CYAN|nr:hypothetical protein D4Z78_03405 [Okeania hirsuta]RQH53571.1 hypothetical protein D5R40_03565 [Okeania hirsuta]